MRPVGARKDENRKMLAAFRWNLRILSYIALMVGAFLTWAAEPKMEERKSFGLAAMIYLVIFSVLLWFSYKRIWKNVAH